MKNSKSRFLTFLFTGLYLLIMGSISFMNSPAGSAILGPKGVPVTSISGCLTALLLILVALITVSSNGKQWILAIVLQSIQLAIVCMSVLRFRKIESIPGAFMISFGIVLILILKTYIRRIVSNENELDKMSFTDVLTGLPNRRSLMAKMSDMKAAKKEFFLIFLDLDNFKVINDTLGHDKGDELLRFVSGKWRLLEDVSPDYHLYRLGGDEFAMLVETDNEVLLYDVCSYAVSCLNDTANDFSGIVTCSAGYARYPLDTDSISDILTYADMAMYKAKNAGKNQLKRFDKNMFSELVSRFNIEKDLKTNLEEGEIRLVYQGQNYASTGEPYGWEVLSRMHDRYGENISPTEFIGTAEKSTLIYEIDKYVMENALSQTEKYYERGGKMHIAVNISGKHVTAPGFVEEMTKIFEAHPNFPFEMLTIEITESSYVKNINTAQKVLSRLKETGCQIALDDFGTGYSSLCYLSKLPIDYIKIDKSFIDRILLDDTLVKIIIQMGHMLGLKIIAEGVETQEQLDKLNEMGCDLVQGYLFGKSRLWKDWQQNEDSE